MNRRRLLNPAFIVALLTMGAGAAGMKTAIDSLKVVLLKKPIYAEDGRTLRAAPSETANWVQIGRDVVERPDVLEELGTENYLTRRYLEKNPAPDAKPRMLQLHAAYYTGMIDTVPHVPDRCFVGAGFSIVGGPWVVDIPLDTGDWLPAPGLPESMAGRVYTTRLSHEYSTAGRGRRVNLPLDLGPKSPLQFRVTQFSGPGGEQRLEGYFFIANGSWVSNAEMVRIKAFDLTTEYAYYLKVQIGASNVESPQELAEAAASLLNDVLGELMTCVPDWVKVEQGLWPPDNPRRIKPAGTGGRS